MTEQEAIKYLQMATIDDAEGEFCELYKEMCEISIKAIEKQIPKKPIWVERSFTKFQICPSCSNAEHYKMVWKQEKYCVDCGQKLDLGDEDDRDDRN